MGHPRNVTDEALAKDGGYHITAGEIFCNANGEDLRLRIGGLTGLARRGKIGCVSSFTLMVLKVCRELLGKIE